MLTLLIGLLLCCYFAGVLAVACPWQCECAEKVWKCNNAKIHSWPLDNQPTEVAKGVVILDLSGSAVDVLPNWRPTHNFPDLQVILLRDTVFDGERCRELECLEKLNVRVISRCGHDLRRGCAHPPCCPWSESNLVRTPQAVLPTSGTRTHTDRPRDGEYSTRALFPVPGESGKSTTPRSEAEKQPPITINDRKPGEFLEVLPNQFSRNSSAENHSVDISNSNLTKNADNLTKYWMVPNATAQSDLTALPNIETSLSVNNMEYASVPFRSVTVNVSSVVELGTDNQTHAVRQSSSVEHLVYEEYVKIDATTASRYFIGYTPTAKAADSDIITPGSFKVTHSTGMSNRASTPILARSRLTTVLSVSTHQLFTLYTRNLAETASTATPVFVYATTNSSADVQHVPPDLPINKRLNNGDAIDSAVFVGNIPLPAIQDRFLFASDNATSASSDHESLKATTYHMNGDIGRQSVGISAEDISENVTNLAADQLTVNLFVNEDNSSYDVLTENVTLIITAKPAPFDDNDTTLGTDAPYGLSMDPKLVIGAVVGLAIMGVIVTCLVFHRTICCRRSTAAARNPRGPMPPGNSPQVVPTAPASPVDLLGGLHNENIDPQLGSGSIGHSPPGNPTGTTGGHNPFMESVSSTWSRATSYLGLPGSRTRPPPGPSVEQIPMEDLDRSAGTESFYSVDSFHSATTGTERDDAANRNIDEFQANCHPVTRHFGKAWAQRCVETSDFGVPMASYAASMLYNTIPAEQVAHGVRDFRNADRTMYRTSSMDQLERQGGQDERHQDGQKDGK